MHEKTDYKSSEQKEIHNGKNDVNYRWKSDTMIIVIVKEIYDWRVNKSSLKSTAKIG